MSDKCCEQPTTLLASKNTLQLEKKEHPKEVEGRLFPERGLVSKW